MEKNIEKIKQHWNSDAKEVRDFDQIFPLGYAGTYSDYNLQHLEMNAILSYIKDGDSVLELGCGKGYGALFMAWSRNINITGLDYAQEMINESQNNLHQMNEKKLLQGKANFILGDVMKPETLPSNKFDVVYTERCLINITDWNDQKKAIGNISKIVKHGGLLVLQEGSKTSLDKLNEIRERYNLEPIKIVWHNLFFDDEKLIEYASLFFELVKVDNFASTFTLLSRVINPALVAPNSPTPESDINKLALKLPNLGDYGYQKIYVFKKK